MFKDSPKLKNIFFVGFLVSLHLALTAYINSSLLATFVDEKLVGIAYAFGSLGSLLALLYAPKIFGRLGGQKFLLLTSGLSSLSLLALAYAKNAWIAIPVFIIYFALNTLLLFSLDELLKIFSKDSSTGKIRGFYIAVINIAWILSQVASGKILVGFQFKTIYIIAFVIMVLFFLASLFGLRKIPDPKYDEVKNLRYIKEFFQNINLFRGYVLSFLLQFFYCWMVVYTPIYLSAHLGFSWAEIGTIFAIMLIPFSIITFHLGRYADKVGERRLLISGFAIAAAATLSLFFITEHSIWIWAALLFITRIGAATIEVMSDAYFFKHIKPENEEYVGVYRSAAPVSYLIGPLLASVVFLFVPEFNYLYLVLGAIMLYGVYLSSTINRDDI